MSSTHPLTTQLIEDGAARLEIETAEIRVVAGPDRGLKLTLGCDSLLIGSDAGCDIVLHDPTVSARHAEIIAGENGYTIRDLGSTNGLQIGGQLVERAPLSDRTRIQLGDSALVVRALGGHQIFPLASRGRSGQLAAHSTKMRALVPALERLASSDITVLIDGETGTGKELAAQTLHTLSARRSGPFIVFDAAAARAGLTQAELFGHEKGAFTGATDARPGLFEEADGGTLFLDNIAELPIDVQPLLLRAIEQRQARRVGGRVDVSYDVRIVASTHRNLAEEVRAGQFREDLYHRLCVGRLRMPPLRERQEDIVPLAEMFAAETGTTIPPEMRAVFEAYSWPGNVRELRNAVSRLGGADQSPIDQSLAEARRRRDRPAAGGTPLVDASGQLRPWLEVRRLAAEETERVYLKEAIERAQGNLSRAAELAGVSRQAITTLAIKHGLHPRR